MSLVNLTVKSGATMAPTGGTDLVFAPDGQTVQNGISLIVPGDATYATRRRSVMKYTPASVIQQTGMYRREVKTLSYTLPMVLADGSVVFNTIRVTREVHPTLAAASVLDLNVVASQLLTDADTTNFWAYGAMS